MNRTGIINYLAQKIEAETYLEIGVGHGGNFRPVNCALKVGVEPKTEAQRGHKIGDLRDNETVHLMTSDKFFDEDDLGAWGGPSTFDLVFIDGLHDAKQVERDILNALNVLNEGGFIVCHDMNPIKEEYQIVPRTSNVWNGDCWKAWAKVRVSNPDLEMFVVDTDYGCGVINRETKVFWKYFNVDETTTSTILEYKISYNYFNKHRKRLLNLISVEEFNETY